MFYFKGAITFIDIEYKDFLYASYDTKIYCYKK